MTLQFTSRALKVTLMLNPAALVGVEVPPGTSRIPIAVQEVYCGAGSMRSLSRVRLA
jgi:hypothetical protein